jgi:hypothetical protein
MMTETIRVTGRFAEQQRQRPATIGPCAVLVNGLPEPGRVL